MNIEVFSANDQANPAQNHSRALAEAITQKIPQTIKEANGFGSG